MLPSSIIPLAITLLAAQSTSASQYVPNQLANSFTVTTADNNTLVFTMGDRPPSPILLFAVNTTDPFTSFMWRSDDSLDNWLTQAPEDTEYVFLAYDNPATTSSMNDLRTAIINSMVRLNFSLADRQARLAHMHFANTSITADPQQEFLADLLSDWVSPLNVLEISIPSSKDTSAAASTTTTTTTTTTRLDGHYGWCAWPQPGDTGSLVFVRDPCASGAFVPANNTYALVFYENITAACDLATVLDNAQAANANAILFAAAQGANLIEVGSNGAIDAVNLAISMVDYNTGLLLARNAATATFTFQTYNQAGFFAAVDTEGLLQEVGWEKYPMMMMLGWEAQWLDYVTELRSNLSKPALVVPVMDNLQMLGTPGAVANISIPLPIYQSLHEYADFELDMALTCPGNMDTDCAIWDHTVNLYVCCSPDAHGYAGSKDGLCNMELGRWITPFRRRIGRWLTPVTQLLPLLTSSECTFTMQTPPWATAWVVSLNLRFTNPLPGTQAEVDMARKWGGLVPRRIQNTTAAATSPSAPPVALIPLFQGGTFDQNYNNRTPVVVSIPASTKRVELEAVITGHGSDNNGCGEFCPTSHHFVINGHESMVNFTEAGTPFGCADKVRQGAEPNEHGTWYYGRNGWCDGQDVRPWVVDVTRYLHIGGSEKNTIVYFGWYGNGTPNPTENPGEIIMYSNLVLYE